MKVGISGLVIPQEWSLDEVLDNITADGYEALELALRDEGHFSIGASRVQLKEVAVKAADAGVELVSICPSLKSRPRDFMTNQSDVRKASIEALTETMEVATVVGVDTVLLVMGRLTPELYYDEAYANALSSLRKVAMIAEDKGVKIAIEYVWNDFLLSPLEFARFCDEVDSPNVGFYFDTGNMVNTGYPQHWARICGEHLMAVHVKDFQRNGYEWKPLGEGDVDFPAVMAELKKIGFDGALVSEVEADLATFAETARAIEKIIADAAD